MTSRLFTLGLRCCWQGDQAVAHPPKSLCRGQRWPLWAQTSRLVPSDCLHKCL